MGKDETADEPARAIELLREIEASAAELVELGDLLLGRGEPSDLALLQRYQLYQRVEAALALPPGLERVAALHAAKVGKEALSAVEEALCSGHPLAKLPISRSNCSLALPTKP